MNLLKFLRPSRYINSEINSVHKTADLKVALAFPDVYEVGMSHLGLKILYGIINELPYASAERVFAPWGDLDEAMKNEGELLGTLETGRPLKDFDVVGFSLQYELAYTTVLSMLDRGGIPVRSGDRLDESQYPLVIAGGPSTLNPWPMSAFIDAFLVGDGEDAVNEILSIVFEWKKSGGGRKDLLLRALSEIEGVFVPTLGRDKEVRRRVISSLEESYYPVRPVLPYADIVHDRINIEIARGCSMGCRFCQAGMAYRPVRERSVSKILSLAAESIKNTGYDDISFTSLSAGDYSCLLELMQQFNQTLSNKSIAMSLPSLRVGSVSSPMLKELRSVRKSGFTIAPEAGTDRLRAVINKDFTAERYQQALETLFAEGWSNLKLYFMTGLPTETDEDIAAIPEMALQAIRTSKKFRGRHVTISAGVSSFIPKPHTPFQWVGQNDIEQLREKNNYLRKEFLRKGIKFKGHNEDMSLLEAVFARGDEALGALIEKAWSLGARLDAWTECFDIGKWQKASELAAIDLSACATRSYKQDERVPWDNILTGVSKEFLWDEYQKSVFGRFTKDCRQTCQACGLACSQKPPQADPAWTYQSPAEISSSAARPSEQPVRYRLKYTKLGRLRFLSHLELMTSIIRAMKRSGIRFAYSTGFHPAPRLSFGPALSVGIASSSEFLDLELKAACDIRSTWDILNARLPEGIEIRDFMLMTKRGSSLNSFIVKYDYEVQAASGLSAADLSGTEQIIVERKKGPVNIRPMIIAAERLDSKRYKITVKDDGENKVRLDEILQALFGCKAADTDVMITRLGMYGFAGRWVDPLAPEVI